MTAFRRKLIAAFALCAGGTLFQLLPGSCYQLVANQAVVAFDFCGVLNCEGGAFFNFCEPIVLFVDCPNQTTTP
ncbi:MAG: hypothetical protein U1D55_04745 [Phycisphaerae bacterium]